MNLATLISGNTSPDLITSSILLPFSSKTQDGQRKKWIWRFSAGLVMYKPMVESSLPGFGSQKTNHKKG